MRPTLPPQPIPAGEVSRLVGVSSSISTPSERSLSRATSRSSAAGTGVHAALQLAAASTRCSADSACSANEMSITAAGMALGGREVHDAALGEQVQPPAADGVLLHQRAHLAVPASPPRRSPRDVDLDVEVARVGEHGAVLHALEVRRAEHVAARR